MHGKAFEIGLFTLDKDFRVFINLEAMLPDSSFSAELKSAHGKQIRISTIAPLSAALTEHWTRVKLYPGSEPR
jgi:hypothetical protein